MKLTTDDRCRLASQELFKPRTDYEAERQSDGRIVLTEAFPKEIPTLKPRRVKGRLRGAEISLNRAPVAAARFERGMFY